jgi:predicted cupin superfamily sugar epimerase
MRGGAAAFGLRPLSRPSVDAVDVRDPDELIEALGLAPHPEGGWYAETWRGDPGPDGRAVGTAIYFLLRAGERSHWHRVDAAEVWLFHAGAPLELRIDDEVLWLGPDLATGQRPQAVVPPGAWQAAQSTGDWTLVSCVVAPGFEFEGFELAPPDWSPTTT